MSRGEVVALIIAVADDFGLDRVEFLGGAVAESGLDPAAWRQGAWPDWSVGLFQQTIKYAPDGDGSARDDNVRFVRELFTNDPAHAARVAAKQYKGFRAKEATALDAWCRYNSPGLTPAENPNRANYERGLREAAAILATPKEQPMPDAKPTTINADDVNIRSGPGTSHAVLHAPLKAGSTVWPTDAPPVTAEGHTWRQVALGLVGWVAAEYLGGLANPVVNPPPVLPPAGLTFNPGFDLRLQVQDFACSIRTTQMLLESVGLVGVDIGTLQMQMVPKYVTAADGLLDGSGAGIVRLLREEYGVQAHTISPVTFAQVSQLAGVYPIGLGGHGWNHWAAVRRFDGERLILANPGGTGPRYGQQTLDRQQFADLGPFSAVVVTGRI